MLLGEPARDSAEEELLLLLLLLLLIATCLRFGGMAGEEQLGRRRSSWIHLRSAGFFFYPFYLGSLSRHCNGQNRSVNFGHG